MTQSLLRALVLRKLALRRNMRKQALAEAAPQIYPDVFHERFLDHTYELLTEGQVEDAMDDLLVALRARRLRSHHQEWQEFKQHCLEHAIRELLHQDPLTRRAFTKPRGYPGDAMLLDLIYGREERWSVPEGTTELGKKVFDYTTRSDACEGVRARRGFIAHLIDRLVEEVQRPHLLSVAAGHLREVLLCGAVKRGKIGRYVALDGDRESLEEINRCNQGYDIETLHATIRHLLAEKIHPGEFDLIYSTGMYDYLQHAAGQRLTWILFRMLRPRGRLLLANFLPGILGIGYMETFMDWKLVYRTRREMLDLSMNIPQREIRDIKIFAEENQNILFLEITKR
jgi:extracellular factor (EF) 3-hydroxypalmitic acid methyl ester biosynthesis protein